MTMQAGVDRPYMKDIALNRAQHGLGYEQRLPTQRSHVVKFMEKVAIKPRGCWMWQGYIKPNGYGYYRHEETTWAHRVSYMLFRGPVENDMVIDHLCRNRACVNPDHLAVVTQRENVMRGKPWTVCDRYHPGIKSRFAERGDGRKYCRECNRVREAMRRAAVTT